jgi:hypothetical protein
MSSRSSRARPPTRAPRSPAPWLRRTSAALLAALTLASTSPAFSQSKADLDRARTLFREGVALSAAQDWSGALAKFKQVAQVKMTPQVAFNIAECEEHLGRLLSALGNYRLAQSEAAAPNSNAGDVAKQVEARVSALEGRIPKLTIKRGEGADSATVELDGVEIGAAQIGAPILVDPGPHSVVGKIGGKEGWRETVSIAEKETKEVTVVIDVAAMPKEPVAPPPTATPDAPPPPPPSSKLPGAIITGVGAASIAAGVVFLILRQGTISDLEEQCAGGPGGDEACPPEAESTADDGKLFTGLAEVTIAAGVVGVAVGVVLLVRAGKSAPPPASAKLARRARSDNPGLRFVGAAPGANVGGASVLGRF